MTASPSPPLLLDIRLIEEADPLAESINLTDDNCGTTCPKACCTSAQDALL